MEKTKTEIRSGSIIFLLILILLISPIIYFSFNLLLGVWGFKRAEMVLEQGDLRTAEKNIFLVQGSAERNKKFLEISQPVFKILGFGEGIEKIENLFSLIEVLGKGVGQTVSAVKEGKQILKGTLLDENINLEESLSKIKIETGNAYENFSLSQNLLDNFSGREPIFGSFILRAKKELPSWRFLLSQVHGGAGTLGEILGSKERKTYLLLFQNNMELRPTGGFIGSYGLLTFERGKLLDFEVQDVYWADGRLRGYVEPPPKLKEFLGTGGWYLRDSNWDPDFPTSALRAEWFLEKEVGRPVDGVVGVNLFLAQKILGVFEEIEIPDYNEKITPLNFFERAQFHSEINFFPGSTAKKDFLGAVTRILFEKLKTANEKQLAKIAQVFYQSLREKDLLIFFNGEEAQKVIDGLGWNGAIKNVKCKIQKECLEDYLMIVEANVGVNKANYFLERSLELETQVGPGDKIEKKLLIFYQNKSPSEIFPAGKYKNYLRLYLPEGSVLMKCQVDGEECKIEEETEHQREIFGFLVEVPAGGKRKVEVGWQIEGSFRGGDYRFLWQKQPGTRNDPLMVSFGGLTQEGLLRYNDSLSEDRIFEFNLKR